MRLAPSPLWGEGRGEGPGLALRAVRRVVRWASAHQRPHQPVGWWAEAHPTEVRSAGQLLGPEDLVARIAQSRQDVALVVEPLVDRRGVDLHVRMRGLDALQ